jgi:hypothetical protein
MKPFPQTVWHFGLWLIFICTLLLVVLLHLLLLNPGVDAGIHMYGSFLIIHGSLPYRDLWNNKPPLIYLLGTTGFLLKSNPFLGVRMFELIVFFADLLLVKNIVRRANLGYPLLFMLTFSSAYLLCWDQGFLTETFVITINLLSVFLFLRKTRQFEWIGGLLLVLTFLLKQNAFTVMAGIMLLDIFTLVRPGGRLVKAMKWMASLTCCSLAVFGILKGLGIWRDFADQVFIYNHAHVMQSSLKKWIPDHLLRNSFLSFHGISLIMVFNLVILITLWKYLTRWTERSQWITGDYLILSAMLIYSASYYFVYISGKSYPHYFMLLLVPAVFIMGHLAAQRTIGMISLLLLCVWAWLLNIPLFSSAKKMEENRERVASYIRDHSKTGQPIHVAGFGNQYLYVMAERTSNSKFLLPLFEPDGYTNEYKHIIVQDFRDHPPQFFVLNKNSYRSLDSSDFYTKVVMQTMQGYRPVFESTLFVVLQRP